MLNATPPNKHFNLGGGGQGAPGAPGKSQEDPGGDRKSQSSPGVHRGAQEGPRGHRVTLPHTDFDVGERGPSAVGRFGASFPHTHVSMQSTLHALHRRSASLRMNSFSDLYSDSHFASLQALHTFSAVFRVMPALHLPRRRPLRCLVVSSHSLAVNAGGQQR